MNLNLKKCLALISLVSFTAAVAIIVALAPSTSEGDWLTQSQYLGQALNVAGPLILICLISLLLLVLAVIWPAQPARSISPVKASSLWQYPLKAQQRRSEEQLRQRMNA